MTCLNFIELQEKGLITASHDSFIRIWSLQGQLIGNVKITHPLPIYWNIQQDEIYELRKKLYYTLRVLEVAMIKFKND